MILFGAEKGGGLNIRGVELIETIQYIHTYIHTYTHEPQCNTISCLAFRSASNVLHYFSSSGR